MILYSMFIRWVLEHFQTNFRVFLIKIICLINQGFFRQLKDTQNYSTKFLIVLFFSNSGVTPFLGRKKFSKKLFLNSLSMWLVGVFMRLITHRIALRFDFFGVGGTNVLDSFKIALNACYAFFEIFFMIFFVSQLTFS